MRVCLFLSFAAAILALCGCGGNTVSVSGTVTFEGKPLPEGDIVFVDPDGKQPPDAGRIKDGTYSIPVKPGKKKVEIRATKKQVLPAGKKGPMGEMEMPVDYIPERYNAKTGLTADVSSSSSTHDFTLTAQ